MNPDLVTLVLWIGVMINITIFSLTPIFIYAVIAFDGFRAWVKRLIEDDDGIAHKQDAKDAVILFFAIIFSWALIDLILLEIIYPLNNGIVLIGIVSGI